MVCARRRDRLVTASAMGARISPAPPLQRPSKRTDLAVRATPLMMGSPWQTVTPSGMLYELEQYMNSIANTAYHHDRLCLWKDVPFESSWAYLFCLSEKPCCDQRTKKCVPVALCTADVCPSCVDFRKKGLVPDQVQYSSVLSKWEFFINMKAAYLLSPSFIT